LAPVSVKNVTADHSLTTMNQLFVSFEKRVRNIHRDRWKHANAGKDPTKKKTTAIIIASMKRLPGAVTTIAPAKRARAIPGKYAGPAIESRRRGANSKRSQTPHPIPQTPASAARRTMFEMEGGISMLWDLTQRSATGASRR
jgi:hypothetical protein